jgi:hypothetical protein
MNRRRLTSMLCLTALLFGVGAGHSAAQPLTLFREQDQAQRHCPGDIVVWVDFQTRRYYSPGQARYGQGRHGTFACRTEVRRSGYRRSLFGRR